MYLGLESYFWIICQLLFNEFNFIIGFNSSFHADLWLAKTEYGKHFVHEAAINANSTVNQRVSVNLTVIWKLLIAFHCRFLYTEFYLVSLNQKI